MEKDREKLKLIQRYNFEGKYNKARELLEQIHKERVSFDEEVLLEFGQNFLGLQNFDRAEECFVNVLEINKYNKYALIGFLKSILYQNKYCVFIEELKKVRFSKLDIKDREKIIVELIDVLTKNKQYEQVINIIEKEALLQEEYRGKVIDDTLGNFIKEEEDKEKFNIKDIDSSIKFYFKLNGFEKYKKYDKYIFYLKDLLKRIFCEMKQSHFRISLDLYKKLSNTIKNNDINIRNMLDSELAYSRKELILKSYPILAEIAVTNKCNSRCRMCNSRYDIPWSLSDVGFKNILNIIPYLNSVSWIGGEVHLYDKFYELAKIAYNHGVKQLIITNGINWDKALLRKLIEMEVSFKVSIDSFDREVYKYIRGIDGLENALDFIKFFNLYRTQKNKLQLQKIIMKTNYKELECLSRFCTDNKVDLCYITPLYRWLNNDFFEHENIFFETDDGITLKEYNSYMGEIYKLLERLERELKNNNIEVVNQIPIIKHLNFNRKEQNINKVKEMEQKEKEQKKGNNTENICYAPWKHLFVRADGRCYPDPICRESLYIGNINTQNFCDIWNGKSIIDIRKKCSTQDNKQMCDRCLSVSY